MNVSITLCREGVALPAYQTNGAVGFDLSCAEKTIVEPHTLARIPTGLIIKTPPEYMLMLTARSSTPWKKGLMLANGVGIIDQDYCGEHDEIMLLVYNITDKPVVIEQGDRLANGIFVPIQKVEWIFEHQPSSSSRGGFGSTGK